MCTLASTLTHSSRFINILYGSAEHPVGYAWLRVAAKIRMIFIYWLLIYVNLLVRFSRFLVNCLIVLIVRLWSLTVIKYWTFFNFKSSCFPNHVSWSITFHLQKHPNMKWSLVIPPCGLCIPDVPTSEIPLCPIALVC